MSRNLNLRKDLHITLTDTQKAALDRMAEVDGIPTGRKARELLITALQNRDSLIVGPKDGEPEYYDVRGYT